MKGIFIKALSEHNWEESVEKFDRVHLAKTQICVFTHLINALRKQYPNWEIKIMLFLWNGMQKKEVKSHRKLELQKQRSCQ